MKFSFALYDSDPKDSPKAIIETIFLDTTQYLNDRHMFEYLCQSHEYGTIWVVKRSEQKIEWIRKRVYKNKEPLPKWTLFDL